MKIKKDTSNECGNPDSDTEYKSGNGFGLHDVNMKKLNRNKTDTDNSAATVKVSHRAQNQGTGQSAEGSRESANPGWLHWLGRCKNVVSLLGSLVWACLWRLGVILGAMVALALGGALGSNAYNGVYEWPSLVQIVHHLP